MYRVVDQKLIGDGRLMWRLGRRNRCSRWWEFWCM